MKVHLCFGTSVYVDTDAVDRAEMAEETMRRSMCCTSCVYIKKVGGGGIDVINGP